MAAATCKSCRSPRPSSPLASTPLRSSGGCGVGRVQWQTPPFSNSSLGSKLGWVEIGRGSCSLTVLIDVLCLICHLFSTPPVICATSLRAFITARLASFSTLVSCGSCILQRGLPNRPTSKSQHLCVIVHNIEINLSPQSSTLPTWPRRWRGWWLNRPRRAYWNGAVASSTARTYLFQAY